MNPFIHANESYCYKCHNQSIDIIDIHNKRIGYPDILMRADMDRLIKAMNITELHKMKCLNCGEEYHINWTGVFPRPIVIEKEYAVDHFLY